MVSSARYVSSALNGSLCASRFPVSRSSEANDCSARDSDLLKTRHSSVITFSRNRGSCREYLCDVPCLALSRASSMATQSCPLGACADIAASTNGNSPACNNCNPASIRSRLLVAIVIASELERELTLIIRRPGYRDLPRRVLQIRPQRP